MKFLAVVFVFAFVAVQFSCSAPNPDDDKKEEAGGSPAHVTDPGLPTSELLAATASNNLPSKQQVRHLNVHEYVSYTLLRDNGIPVPKFNIAKTKDEAVKYAQELNSKDIVLKAQVLAGGRGKGIIGNKISKATNSAAQSTSLRMVKFTVYGIVVNAVKSSTEIKKFPNFRENKNYYLIM